ncbi:Bifunctional protein GlmU [Methylobacterium adhaesivum]|jgi:bifunctional UDP-N-acetylglucosamine pyrophosphorylase/glucosamine-1-phosphate N-acetyltransferase|uniref:Bifunctional protein GlmU n=1 Tax=Methylobacterium adhaesivum TaxID=333297 RepID=A0ABT8BGB5_9HYPH|nr:bifunctional UDP-N-acetylglucosamine diphosphorylase/glucosamine-1-phosphate N-acetyltransferase GlmU [Methylobacterium adhaesivum]MDN3591177.1 bifunctional UDP-N-acetylglucosamine diphosphorylase/glucosamine-1-phosphate N-acetyltransferase GlmU [Methylobacterium adhaesivum]GJD32213.1 Bifunctional protein GlmU [Methylobacterium adhaesivum]
MSAATTTTTGRSLTAIVLAAGKGTRMRSDLPKVLHAVAGRTMLGHVLAAARAAGAGRIAVVVEPGQAAVAREIERAAPGAAVFPQTERLGTAHAVLAAREALEAGDDDVIVAFGDTPLVTGATLARLRAPLADGAAVAVLAFDTPTPTGYGRVLTEGGRVVAIREEKDATAPERAVTLCNAGLMALSGAHALALLTRIGNANAAGEYYLPDAVALAVADGLMVAVVAVDEAEAQGVNDRVQLAVAEAEIQGRLRRAAQIGGATLVAPETVFLSADTVLGRDVLVEPHVVFGPGVTVGDGCTIHAFSHLEGASLAPGVAVGPYARLRPGAVLETGAKVGNFVEIKNARLGAGAKANHLSYLGDAEIGAGANIGAGTITCNYDGVNKHRTAIGPGAFIGSNTALVAPVSVGAGAIVGAGSVIADDVADEALAVSRARQRTIANWAPGKRAALAAEKARRTKS